MPYAGPKRSRRSCGGWVRTILRTRCCPTPFVTSSQNVTSALPEIGEGYYCWSYPEETIGHYHGYDEGFAGRIPIH